MLVDVVAGQRLKEQVEFSEWCKPVHITMDDWLSAIARSHSEVCILMFMMNVNRLICSLDTVPVVVITRVNHCIQLVCEEEKSSYIVFVLYDTLQQWVFFVLLCSYCHGRAKAYSVDG